MPTTKSKTRTKPRISFTALAKFMNTTPTGQVSIVRDQKHPPTFMTCGYRHAIEQLRCNAVRGAPLDPLAGNLEPHEAEVVTIMEASGWRPPTPIVRFPSTHQDKLVVNDVEISAYPDLVLETVVRKRKRTGALKYYFPKTTPLTEEVGKAMASLLLYYQREVLGDESAHPSTCMVYDVRGDIVYEAGRRHVRLLQRVESACVIIRALWPDL